MTAYFWSSLELTVVGLVVFGFGFHPDFGHKVPVVVTVRQSLKVVQDIDVHLLPIVAAPGGPQYFPAHGATRIGQGLFIGRSCHFNSFLGWTPRIKSRATRALRMGSAR